MATTVEKGNTRFEKHENERFDNVVIVESKTKNKKLVNKDIIDIEMANFFSSSELLNLINKWKFHLLVIVGVAAILAAIFSGPTFITPLYKSSAVLYPANVDSYSEESETEQMLQIFDSQDIKDSVIKMFELDRHYDINKDYEHYKTVLYYEYSEKVKIGKTPFEAVSIEVLDRSPDTAALIVSAIIDFYDKKIARLHKSKYFEVADMYRKQLKVKEQGIDSLKSILKVLGQEHGIIEYNYQSQEIMRGLLGTVDGSGSNINKKEVNRLTENMEEYSGQLIEVVEMIQAEARTYVEIKLDYELALRFLGSDMTYSNIISAPFVTDKKEYPVRWIIVLVTIIAAFVFSMLIIMFIENQKKS